MRSIAILIVRLTVGGLLAGHGAQKLFGWFGGRGLQDTAGWLESLHLRPGRAWARIAGGSELTGGLFTAAGFLNPLGPIAGMGAMSMAILKVHRGRPVWSTSGGAELALTNTAALAALALSGPGRLSVDGVLRTGMSRKGALLLLSASAAGLWIGASAELREEVGELGEQAAEVVGALEDQVGADAAPLGGDRS